MDSVNPATGEVTVDPSEALDKQIRERDAYNRLVAGTQVNYLPKSYVPKSPTMEPVIAAACVDVVSGIKRLAYDESNEHAKYPYASIDAFYEALGPLLSAAGLMSPLLNELSAEIRESSRGSPWLFVRYEIYLVHKSGVMWGPSYRSCAMAMTGPQTYAALESFVRKGFMRGIFMVPTGEPDGDDTPKREDAPATRGGEPPKTVQKHQLAQTPDKVAEEEARRIADLGLYRSIQNEIDSAVAIDKLNESGVFRPTAGEDKERLEKRSKGAWQRLVDRDAKRRVELLKTADEQAVADGAFL